MCCTASCLCTEAGKTHEEKGESTEDVKPAAEDKTEEKTDDQPKEQTEEQSEDLPKDKSKVSIESLFAVKLKCSQGPHARGPEQTAWRGGRSRK